MVQQLDGEVHKALGVIAKHNIAVPCIFCKEKPQQSHSISRGNVLMNMAGIGPHKIYEMDFFRGVDLHFKPTPELHYLWGIGKASVFSNICNKHDKEFWSLDDDEFTGHEFHQSHIRCLLLEHWWASWRESVWPKMRPSNKTIMKLLDRDAAQSSDYKHQLLTEIMSLQCPAARTVCGVAFTADTRFEVAMSGIANFPDDSTLSVCTVNDRGKPCFVFAYKDSDHNKYSGYVASKLLSMSDRDRLTALYSFASMWTGHSYCSIDFVNSLSEKQRSYFEMSVRSGLEMKKNGRKQIAYGGEPGNYPIHLGEGTELFPGSLVPTHFCGLSKASRGERRGRCIGNALLNAFATP